MAGQSRTTAQRVGDVAGWCVTAWLVGLLLMAGVVALHRRSAGGAEYDEGTRQLVDAMAFLAVAGLIGLLPAWLAQRKGYSFAGWWLFGAAVFIVALPVSLLMKPNPQTRRPCPLCRSVIDVQARVCPQCGRDVFEALAAQPS